MTGISEKILASINSKLIGNWVSLKDVICGENGLENDWTNFINTCGELVNKVAQFYPMETFQMFVSHRRTPT